MANTLIMSCIVQALELRQVAGCILHYLARQCLQAEIGQHAFATHTCNRVSQLLQSARSTIITSGAGVPTASSRWHAQQALHATTTAGILLATSYAVDATTTATRVGHFLCLTTVDKYLAGSRRQL